MNGTEETRSPAAALSSALPLSSSSSSQALAARKRLTPALSTTTLDATSNKKPRLDSALTSNVQDDDEDKSEQEMQLESFRKQAIWREMREYRRRFEHAQRQVEQLTLQNARTQARLAAVDASWNLLVREADLLLPSTSTASNGHSSNAGTSLHRTHSKYAVDPKPTRSILTALTPAVSDRSLTEEQLDEALALRSAATKALLGRLQTLHPSNASTSDEKVADLENQCRELLKEATRSQEALRLLRQQHEQVVEQVEDTQKRLARAEKKFDRAQSSTVTAVEGRSGPTKGTASGSSSPKIGANPNGIDPHGPNSIKADSAAAARPASPLGPRPTVIDPELLEELHQLRSIGQMRAQELDELRGERVRLRSEVDALKTRLVELPEDVVSESTPFKLMQNYVQHLTVEIELRRGELEKLVAEVEVLREGQQGFKAKTFKEANEQVEDLQKRMLAKEQDLSRIRAQREDLRAEASELKARDTEKFTSVNDLNVLVKSREDRITALLSEVRRLKMVKAASEGDAKRVEMHAAADEEDLVKDLSSRIEKAEALLLALRDQLHSYAAAAGATANGAIDASTIVQSEMDARKELSEAKAQLAKFEPFFGPGPEYSSEAVARKITAATERLAVAEAQVQSNELATNMLYSEIDRLSAAWSTLDEQQSSKAAQLHALEEKVHRSATEKTKADNRYFQTMRQKEALVAENAVLTKLADKQNRALEAGEEARHALGDRLAATEKEITLHQRNLRLHQDQLALLKRENVDLTLKHDQQVKVVAELQALLNERVAQAEHENAGKRRAEESVQRLERDLATAKATVKTQLLTGGGAGSSKDESTQLRELKSFNDDLSKMLKCSTCNLRFKSVIIDRCHHLFCKDCIDARLSNRQRKCPTCGAAFGKDDVSTVYF
ncbi:BZ3500_MvSof-1268-A1-R1_Chr9g10383 [Microbotryum saponariae]|uniref:E3 ubiquitin protein ligase n=1 Tax=Microbotryum saponariae TaxID=289078 RepID=A0A2X0N457_9BASI|nr:BZ3501_MvSof-1269-A2-R1_Chr9g10133 [Microbotryum saponariae]SCZ99996.1 BZ3500_MvSof-1268-A1-R1_Chr9g10383 [Microbotryum saponariae]